jgi:hypothetical protein
MRQIVQNYFAVHLHPIRSTSTRNYSRKPAKFFHPRHAQRKFADAKSPYIIEVFFMSATKARCAVTLSFNATSRATTPAQARRCVTRARHVYTSLSGVGVFFIAL